MELLVQKIDKDAVMPYYAHKGDAGLDLFSIEEIEIGAGEIKLVRTGIIVQLPQNTEAQIRPRSGLALKHGITLLNSPGTIDEGYRGEIKVIMINHGKEKFNVTKGMKIAQMVVQPVISVTVRETENINKNETERSVGGFGSTGF